MAAERTFVALLHTFIESRRVRGYSKAGDRRAERILNAFFAYLIKRRVRAARSVQEKDVVAFLRHVQTLTNRFSRPVSPDQLRHYLGAIRAFFRFIEKRGQILASPAHGVTVPKVERLPRTVLSQAEASRLMSAPHSGSRIGQRDRALLEVLYGTGVRLSECLRLNLTDLNLLDGVLLVRNGKGRKDRIVPISGRAVFALDLYLREGRRELSQSVHEGALFLSRDGRRLSATRLNYLLAQHACKAGIKKRVHPHVLRHSYATHLLQGGADVRHVQQLLGHSSLQMTALYTHLDVTDLRQMIKRCHPRER